MPLDFVHVYEPPPAPYDTAGRPAPTLLLLHGTGGDENDLLPMGRMLRPDAGLLSPRGQVLEGSMPRFFRRLAEGVFDQADLSVRTAELADFVAEAAETYDFSLDHLVAVGFSNGANIAASLILTRPGLLPRAVLLSPMVPFTPAEQPDLHDTRVLIVAGARDPIAPPREVDALVKMLREAGATVSLHWEPGGHQLTPAGVEAARTWLAAQI